jgi:DNA invertase Pin-like site-specific DNA recombinase
LDAGKSGLRIEDRAALKQLIKDVETRRAGFSAILVYDVSRWGRFQDTDESAYYEYLCRRANIQVHYCAEPFDNDGSATSAIVKSIKRVMAAEYSRELSNKVFIGMCRLIELGFRQGGCSGIGLRRMLRDIDGNFKGLLKRGEQKSISTDRVVLVPGPPDEVEIVRSIYRMFVEEKLSKGEISRVLIERGAKTEWGHRWNRACIHEVLTNEKYIGNNVYYKSSFKLHKRWVRNPENIWIRKPAAFESIISSELFYKAQALMAERKHSYTNEELLDRLRGLLQRQGHLTRRLIDQTEGMHCGDVYRKRFTSLITAFDLVGYIPRKDFRYTYIDRELRGLESNITTDIVDRIRKLGGTVTCDPLSATLTINNEFTASIIIARCRRWMRAPSRHWFISAGARSKADIAIVVRMDAENRAPQDYYILPRLDGGGRRMTLREENGAYFDTYRFSSLEFFFGMVRRAKAPESV